MIVTTTTTLDGLHATHYLGVVSGEAILGADIFRDFFAGVRDIVGGRSAAYEQQLREAKQIAFGEMTAWAASLGANAVIGVDLDYETIGGSMLMVATSGTAVYVVPAGQGPPPVPTGPPPMPAAAPADRPGAPVPPGPPATPPVPPAPPAAPPAGAGGR